MRKNQPKQISQIVRQLQQVIEQSGESEPTQPSLPAAELAAKLDLALSAKGCDQSDIITALQRYLQYSPDTSRTDFNKLLFSGLDAPGVLADWVTSMSNTTMHTYQVAPVATLMEQEIIKTLNCLIGFEQGDGIMVSGGSMANMLAMMLARHRKCPEIKKIGFTSKPLVAFVSELAHYSFEKAANTLGIGTQNLITVASDAQGRIDVDELDDAIQTCLKDDKIPFFIGLTAGTTIIGSFDPVAKAANIAKKYALWLHIDGAWGAPVLFSDKHKHLLADTALADSFTWDAHKLMNIPLTASAILLKDNKILGECCAGGGEAYLFHEDQNTAHNLGKKSLQCGRRVDSLKLWLSWKAKGSSGYARKIDHLMALKVLMLDKINATAEFTLLAPADFLNVLFRFEPQHPLKEAELADLNIAICTKLFEQNLGFVDYAQYKGRLGIRYILANGDMDTQHIDQFLAHCYRLGMQLSERQAH